MLFRSARQILIGVLVGLVFPVATFAAVDDNWGEALRKSAEQSTPGVKAEYQFKNRIVASALPDGAATSALQQDILNELTLFHNDTDINFSTVQSKQDTLLAEIQSLHSDANSKLDTIASHLNGKAAVFHVRNDYTSVAVTTSAYLQLVASTSATVTEIYIFDSSGQTLVLATGGAGLEVDQIYIVPGGNDVVPLAIAAGTRVSIKAVSGNATKGEIVINGLN